jgi:peptide/nickel transport system substrate-binding protein
VEPAKRAVFEKTSFRRAVSYALDRDGIVRSVLLGLGSPQFGIISSGNKVWYDAQIAKTPFDLSRSKSLLAESGLKDVDGDGTLDYGTPARPLEITILTSSGTASREKVCEILRRNLADVGIRAGIQFLQPGELGARLGMSFDYEAILFGFTPSDVAPDLQSDLWYSRGSSHFWNPGQKQPATAWEAEIDALTTRLAQTPDPAARLKAASEVQRIWAAQMPAIATTAPNILTGWRNTVGNTRPSILPPYLLWNSEELTKRAR